MSNCPDRETRRRWVLRILDHDGYGDDEGGIETGRVWAMQSAFRAMNSGR